MSFAVCGFAVLKCSSGSAPSVLNIAPSNACLTSAPLANIMDNKPAINILPFGTCANLSGAPCVPATTAPWLPGSTTVFLKNCPLLNKESILFCAMGGMIEIVDPGQKTIQIP